MMDPFGLLFFQAEELVSTSLACLSELGSKSLCSSPTANFGQVSLQVFFNNFPIG